MGLFGRKSTTPLEVIQQQVQEGESMRGLIDSPQWKSFVDVILNPLEAKAFETFKKVDASDVYQVIEAQMMSKMIDAIRREVDLKIQVGDVARIQLLNYSTQEEGE